MYGIIGEDKSDVATLKVILKRLLNNDGATIRTKGYSGCAQMLHKGAKQIDLFHRSGTSVFVICYDSDGYDPRVRYDQVVDRIINNSGQRETFCVLIPVHELETWILADISSAKKVFTGWRPASIANPEKIVDPKEYLENLSKSANNKPRYSHAMHNEKMANHLDLDLVYDKCPSFRPLADLANNGVGNY